MSSFAVSVTEIDGIEGHPNADAIEVAVIKQYRSVVRKVEGYKKGDRVVYIPQASLLPEYLLKRLGLWDATTGKGLLGGSERNRVSAVKLRGLFSQGICLPVRRDPANGDLVWVEGDGTSVPARLGDDVSSFLGIEKWVPTVPDSLLGDVFVVGQEYLVDFDIEDIKLYPDVMIDGEEVEFTEKLHGVFTAVTILPVADAEASGASEFAFGKRKNILVYSKGLGSQGMAFKDTPANASSVYLRSTERLRETIDHHDLSLFVKQRPLTIIGETFGPGVQDLHYGNKVGFTMHGACTGYRGQQTWHDPERRKALARILEVDEVPVIYRGPFSWQALAEHTDGKTMMQADHIREGVVVVPVVDRQHIRLGRVILKSVSEKYLLRKGGTEYS